MHEASDTFFLADEVTQVVSQRVHSTVLSVDSDIVEELVLSNIFHMVSFPRAVSLRIEIKRQAYPFRKGNL